MDDPEQNDRETRVTAASLIEQLVNPDGYPEPRLIAQILALGTKAVEPLRAFIHRDCEEWYEFGAVGFASEILGSLGARSAIPDLLDLFRRVDDEVLEDVALVLADFGPEVIEPTLEIGRDESLPWYSRSSALTAAQVAAGRDPAGRATVARTLRDLLANQVRRGQEAIAKSKSSAGVDPDEPEDEQDEDNGLEAEFREKTTTFVWSLADLADPLARDLIDAAYKADLVDTWLFQKVDVDALYRKGGGEQPSPRDPFVSRYEVEYRDHKDQEQRREERERQMAQNKAFRGARPPLASPKASSPLPPPSAAAKKVMSRTAPQPGRNDPCWCGSGKKYKQCHLRRDQE
jgi:SEC-C motif